MTITSFLMVVGIIGLIAFIGTVIYFHKKEMMPQQKSRPGSSELSASLKRQSRNDSASESKGKKRNKYNASEAGPRSEEKIKKY